MKEKVLLPNVNSTRAHCRDENDQVGWWQSTTSRPHLLHSLYLAPYWAVNLAHSTWQNSNVQKSGITVICRERVV
jgi:hypothetical protein